MMHAFGTNRVAILEQRIYLNDHFRTTITTKTVIIYGQYVNRIYVMKLKCKKLYSLEHNYNTLIAKEELLCGTTTQLGLRPPHC